MRRLSVEIDYTAIQQNYDLAKSLAPKSQVMAVIKANAYGHGMLEVAQTLKNADAFGVATPEEAIALRNAGITNKILVLEGFLNLQELNDIQAAGCDTLIHSPFQVDLLKQTQNTSPLDIWLKIDTGMHRLGIKPADVERLSKTISALPVCQELILMTHLASSEELELETTAKQLEQFQACSEGAGLACSIANSAAIMAIPETHREWVRAGIMLYGASPLNGETNMPNTLTAAMEVTAPLIAIHECKKGDAIGYGGRYLCPTDMQIGVIAIGYGDGYPRHAEDGTPVMINGQRAPLVGRVSMDMITVDVTNCPDIKVGDKALLWGKDLAVETIAQHAETISYELLCQVQAR